MSSTTQKFIFDLKEAAASSGHRRSDAYLILLTGKEHTSLKKHAEESPRVLSRMNGWEAGNSRRTLSHHTSRKMRQKAGSRMLLGVVGKYA